MEAFAERARVELEATGEHARKRTVETLDNLTPGKHRSPASRDSGELTVEHGPPVPVGAERGSRWGLGSCFTRRR